MAAEWAGSCLLFRTSNGLTPFAARLGGAFWEGGAQTFLHKGTNGRWQGVLPEADSMELGARMLNELGADCAAWLKAGGNI